MAVVPKVTLVAVLLSGLSGCVTMGLTAGPVAVKKDGPCRVVVRWLNEVRFAPDTTKGGQLTPGIVGRVYLFGQDVGVPLEGDGALHVELADASQTPPKQLEQWDMDATTVRQLLRKDPFGQGYSIFLPWATFRPDLTRVEMKLAYQPKQGPTLYATPAVVVL